MGLETTFKNAAETAFGIFKDAVTSARFESVATTTYDASSGVVSTIGYSWMVSAIFETYNKRMVDGDRIKPNDVKAMVLPGPFVRAPMPNDTVHIVEANCSIAYRVIDFEIDPMGALYIMQLRKSTE